MAETRTRYDEIFTNDYANAERIRQRVDDPELAEKLIPRDHGSGEDRIFASHKVTERTIRETRSG